MDRLFSPLLVVGLVIAGLGAATAVSIFEGDGRTISVPDDDQDFEDLVEDDALDGLSLSTAAPSPSPGPSEDPALGKASKVKAAAPASKPMPGPRAPRAPGGEDEGGGATNPPGSEDVAVGVGPDINDGQGLPANPTDD